MKYCVVAIKSQTATFRNPEFQSYHKSLTLPPPSTLIGFAGAALGKSPKAAQDYLLNEKLKIGVFGENKGVTNDLWKYWDSMESSVIMREILFNNTFYLVYGLEDEGKVYELGNAFLNPVFALTMGSSDSLAKILFVKYFDDADIISSKEMTNCLVAGDVLTETFEQAKSKNEWEFSIYTNSEPIAYDMPVRFSYEAENGVRRVVERKLISFLSQKMRLNHEKSGLKFDEIFIPIFSLN